MSKQLPKPTPPSRYSYRRVAEEIEALIDLGDVGEQKAAASAAGLDESAFSHRLTGIKSKFTVEQFGCIADHFKAPPGWPFVPMTAAEKRAWQERWRRRR